MTAPSGSWTVGVSGAMWNMQSEGGVSAANACRVGVGWNRITWEITGPQHHVRGLERRSSDVLGLITRGLCGYLGDRGLLKV